MSDNYILLNDGRILNLSRITLIEKDNVFTFGTHQSQYRIVYKHFCEHPNIAEVFTEEADRDKKYIEVLNRLNLDSSEIRYCKAENRNEKSDLNG